MESFIDRMEGSCWKDLGIIGAPLIVLRIEVPGGFSVINRKPIFGAIQNNVDAGSIYKVRIILYRSI